MQVFTILPIIPYTLSLATGSVRFLFYFKMEKYRQKNLQFLILVVHLRVKTLE